MRLLGLLVITVILILSIGLSSGSEASYHSNTEERSKSIDRYIVIFSDDHPQEFVNSVLQNIPSRARDKIPENARIVREFRSFNGKVMLLSNEEADMLAKHSFIISVQKEGIVYAQLQASVPLIRADDVWSLMVKDLNVTGYNQAVCIIDSGIDYKHSAFGNCNVRDFVLNGTVVDLEENISSPNPYPNNYDNTWIITRLGFDSIAVYFETLRTEAYYDYVLVMDGSDNVVQRLEDYDDRFWSVSVPGDTIKIRLVSDVEVTDYGFLITKVLNGTVTEVVDYDSCEKIIDGIDFVNSNNDPFDYQGHGTHVAGIVASNGSVKGVAPEAKLLIVKALNSYGWGLDADIIAGIEWCTNKSDYYNVSAISMSLGSTIRYTDYCDGSHGAFASAINSAVAKNISVVVATGNNGSSTDISSPACIYNSTRVTSTTKTDGISSFSNRNELVSIAAPGTSIYSTYLNNAHGTISGTSMATPHVSGAIALLTQFYNSYNIIKTPAELESLLNDTGVIVHDSSSGRNYSRIDLYSAFDTFGIGDYNITLHSPMNITYSNNSVRLNYTYEHGGAIINKCMYAIDSSEYYIISECNNITLNDVSEGLHNLTVMINLSFEDDIILRNDTVFFTVDTTPPTINMSLIPNNNSAIARNESFMISATDDYSDLDSFLYMINDEEWLSVSQDTPFQPFNDINETSNVTISFFVNDSMGNEDVQVLFYTVDLTNPQINNVSFAILDDSNEFNVTINISFLLSDMVGSGYREVLLKHNDNDYHVMFYDIEGPTQNLSYTYNVIVGNNNFTIIAVDNAHNNGSISLENNFSGMINITRRVLNVFENIPSNITVYDSQNNLVEGTINITEYHNLTINISSEGIVLSAFNLNPVKTKWYERTGVMTINESNSIGTFRNYLGDSASSLAIENFSKVFINGSYSYLAVRFNGLGGDKSIAYYLPDKQNLSRIIRLELCEGVSSQEYEIPCYSHSEEDIVAYIKGFSMIVAGNDTKAPSVEIVSPSSVSERNFQPEIRTSIDVLNTNDAIMQYNGVNETALQIIPINSTHSRVLFNNKSENHDSINEMRWFVNDSAGNMNNTVFQITTINDTLPPKIISISPSNNTIFTSENLNLEIQFNEPVTTSINDSGTIINCTSTYNNANCMIPYSSNTNKTLLLYANDLANNTLNDILYLTRSYTPPTSSSSSGGGGGSSITPLSLVEESDDIIINDTINFIFRNISDNQWSNELRLDNSILQSVRILPNNTSSNIIIIYDELTYLNATREDYTILGSPFMISSNNMNQIERIMISLRLAKVKNESDYNIVLSGSGMITTIIPRISFDNDYVFIEFETANLGTFVVYDYITSIEPNTSLQIEEPLRILDQAFVEENEIESTKNNSAMIIIVIVLSIITMIVSLLVMGKRLASSDKS